MALVHVSASSGYDIRIERGLLGRAGEALRAALPDLGAQNADTAKVKATKVAVITDSNVKTLYAGRVEQSLRQSGFTPLVFAFEAGEASKNHHTLLEIYAFLAAHDFTRSDLIAALGGGVPGDVAGFAAATWQRGVRFIQLPTTLLAQIDSSIGGKTAVDLPEGKNLVGAFWQPSLVLCDPDALDTLDRRIFADGMGEAIKHACIRDAGLFDALSRTEPGVFTPELLRANLEIKRAVVERDEREKGERMLLNFGHTLGHGIEKLTHYTRYTHGEAVAMGMAAITRQSEKRGMTQPGTAAKLEQLLKRHGLPTECPLPVGEVAAAATGDKKRAGDDLRIILLRRIGEAFIHTLPARDFPAFFA